jgi:ubiquinone/menaquinone biosynthesis C-methylase UbiE
MKAQHIAAKEGYYWGSPVAATYFRNAEIDFARQWSAIVAPLLSEIGYHTVVDIAAGRGRNSAKLAEHAQRIICVDINPDNIRYLKERFRNDARFSFILDDGATLADIDDESVDLAYSFDSMVHFDLLVIAAYLEECMRVLRPGGHAFIHHSNFTQNPGGDFRQNPHWRNYMSNSLFVHLSRRAGLSVLSNRAIPWGGIPELDGITLLQKPAA